MRQKLKTIIWESETTGGRAFDFAVMTLIIISVLSFTFETLPNLSEPTKQAFRLIEVVTVVAFTVEYFARIWTAEQPRRYIFGFWGFIDFLAVAPFWLAFGFDLRAVRMLRLFRLLRLLKLFRYVLAFERLKNAFWSIRDELVVFGTIATVLMYFSAVGIYYFENETQPEAFSSIPQSLWWSVVTLTTVGYGDVYPVTTGGRFFTFIVLLIGIGVIAIPTGLIATALTQLRRQGGNQRNSRFPD